MARERGGLREKGHGVRKLLELLQQVEREYYAGRTAYVNLNRAKGNYDFT